ncbi:hypothetical protein ACQFG6_003606 [Klebsiella michiganensis]|uniref:Uncharacterized protein n=1 Tax=Klebsiella michiganensis TaxID=1134687 RepID=A0AB35WC84_9ENTR|nr:MULTISPECIES: hypothetical protein [Enterobacteriaceae]APM34713.1 hypothetical protein AGH21_30800 [Klebsiella oxytoca]HCQ8977511.1 hypothetical protein [Klebsiella variicola]AUU97160.1 hypothetical protein C2U49_21385 [Klebsiella pneumoniae]EWF61529.1 hypothetical protein L387_04994 [Klebsiella michiganensis]KLY31017.1 hypothetical protein SK91_03306 [Klebsiella michiganensis]
MPANNKEVPFDIAAFTMAGNILIALNKKGILSRDEVIDILQLARNQAPRADEIREHHTIDIDWHLDNLKATLKD